MDANHTPGASLRCSALLAIAFFSIVLVDSAGASAAPAGPANAIEALSLCDRADQLAGSERREALIHGLEVAEAAVAANGQDAKAHFAVFCNLGKQMQSNGTRFSDLLALGRLRREIDRTLELAPGDPDALAAKGILLLNLPRLFGGDTARGEQLLREALARHPENAVARQYLVRALRARGANDEAAALLSSS